MIRRPPRSTHCISSAASDVYKRQVSTQSTWGLQLARHMRAHQHHAANRIAWVEGRKGAIHDIDPVDRMLRHQPPARPWAAAVGQEVRHQQAIGIDAVSYTHLRAHETRHDLVCRLLLEKKKKTQEPTE
eukprot:TRINITY_DN14429_c0_g1_i1.p1 TRINITY_DN14429_c0_g1~~TRINITY_DN14429_c0_g1_i1.p1  ORF type:complete len:129 (-),score=26.67 TRINITY_DN14429_c0_g1_i1:39-425(-)